MLLPLGRAPIAEGTKTRLAVTLDLAASFCSNEIVADLTAAGWQVNAKD
jgi:hypothetical protein